MLRWVLLKNVGKLESYAKLLQYRMERCNIALTRKDPTFANALFFEIKDNRLALYSTIDTSAKQLEAYLRLMGEYLVSVSEYAQEGEMPNRPMDHTEANATRECIGQLKLLKIHNHLCDIANKIKPYDEELFTQIHAEAKPLFDSVLRDMSSRGRSIDREIMENRMVARHTAGVPETNDFPGLKNYAYEMEHFGWKHFPGGYKNATK